MHGYVLRGRHDHLHGHRDHLHGHRDHLHGRRDHLHRRRGHLHGHRDRHHGHRDHHPFLDKIPCESWLLHEFQRLLPHRDDLQGLLPRKHHHSMLHICCLEAWIGNLMYFHQKALHGFVLQVVHYLPSLKLLNLPKAQGSNRGKRINQHPVI